MTFIFCGESEPGVALAYETDTDEGIAAAKAALREASEDSAPVYVGDPDGDHQRNGQVLRAAPVRVEIDQENNAEAWWDAARASVDAPKVFARLDAASASGRIECSPSEAAALAAWAETLPGYDDGPAHAAHPFNLHND